MKNLCLLFSYDYIDTITNAKVEPRRILITCRIAFINSQERDNYISNIRNHFNPNNLKDETYSFDLKIKKLKPFCKQIIENQSLNLFEDECD